MSDIKAAVAKASINANQHLVNAIERLHEMQSMIGPTPAPEDTPLAFYEFGHAAVDEVLRAIHSVMVPILD